VLRPGGLLAVFGHAFQLPPDVAEAFAVASQRVVPDSPFNVQAMTEHALDKYQQMYTKLGDGIREAGGFSDPEQWRLDWSCPTPATSGWTRCPPQAASLSSRRTSWQKCWRPSEPPSTR